MRRPLRMSLSKYRSTRSRPLRVKNSVKSSSSPESMNVATTWSSDGGSSTRSHWSRMDARRSSRRPKAVSRSPSPGATASTPRNVLPSSLYRNRLRPSRRMFPAPTSVWYRCRPFFCSSRSLRIFLCRSPDTYAHDDARNPGRNSSVTVAPPIRLLRSRTSTRLPASSR